MSDDDNRNDDDDEGGGGSGSDRNGTLAEARFNPRRGNGGGKGRRRFEPSERQRGHVEALVGYGFSQEEICELIIHPGTGRPISVDTLIRVFRDELRAGGVRVRAKIAESALRQAIGAPAVYDRNRNLIREEQKPVPALTIFMCKVRLGWAEPRPVMSDEELYEKIRLAQAILGSGRLEERGGGAAAMNGNNGTNGHGDADDLDAA